MGDIPVLKPREVEARLFVPAVRAGCSCSDSPSHGNEDLTASTAMLTAGQPPSPFMHTTSISPILLRRIAKDIGLSVQDFIAGKRGE